MNRVCCLMIVAGLAACSDPNVVGPPVERPEAEERSSPQSAIILAPSGWGNVRIGMQRQRAVEAMGGAEEAPLLAEKEVWEACYYLHPSGVPGVAVMIENSRVARIDIYGEARNIITDAGLTLGSTADEVRAAYGPRLEVELGEEGDPPMQFLTWWDQRTGNGIRYIASPDGVITTIIVGGPALRYLEGCS